VLDITMQQLMVSTNQAALSNNKRLQCPHNAANEFHSICFAVVIPLNS